jgi:histidine phosphotransferase ChpT
MTANALDDLDLVALMCSRVCHDVISPVGAITNGLEVLDDEPDEEMRGFAFDLIKKSARQASAKLQFARLAFGAAGSAGAQIDLGDAREVTIAFIGNEKVTLSWAGPAETRPKNEVKLLLNMVLVGMTTIPRGGQMAVTIDGPVLKVACTGTAAIIPAGTVELLEGATEPQSIDARSVQVYYTGRVAASARIALTLDKADDTVTITGTPPGAV